MIKLKKRKSHNGRKFKEAGVIIKKQKDRGGFDNDGNPELSPKERLFVSEYLIDLNATKAYARAGYKSKRPDIDCASLMRRGHVKMAIELKMKERESRTEIKQDDVIKELAKIAFFDIGSLFDSKNNFVGIGKLHKDLRKFVKVNRYPTQYGERISIETIDNRDKLKALELMGKHLGMFTDKLQITNNQTLALKVEVEDLRKRGIDKNDLLNLRNLLEVGSNGNGRRLLTI